MDGTKNLLESLCSLPPGSRHLWTGPSIPGTRCTLSALKTQQATTLKEYNQGNFPSSRKSPAAALAVIPGGDGQGGLTVPQNISQGGPSLSPCLSTVLQSSRCFSQVSEQSLAQTQLPLSVDFTAAGSALQPHTVLDSCLLWRLHLGKAAELSSLGFSTWSGS